MTTSRTRKHIFKFYGTLLCLLVLCLGLGTLYLIVFIDIFSKGEVHTGNYFFLVASIAMYILGAYVVPTYIRAAPTASVDLVKITINEKSILWDEIENIVLTGKKRYKMLWAWQRLEGMTLYLKNGSAIDLYDDYYHNLWQIKLFISQNIQGKNTSELIPLLNDRLADEHFEKFKNSQFTSFHGLLTLFFGFFFLIMAIGSNSLSLIFLILFGALMFVILSMQMHFFEVSESFLLVQNHNFFWRRKVYRLEDIKEVVFETRPKMPNSFRIITRDFKQRVYPAATLRDKTWLRLMDKLESKGIKIRNELPIRR